MEQAQTNTHVEDHPFDDSYRHTDLFDPCVVWDLTRINAVRRMSVTERSAIAVRSSAHLRFHREELLHSIHEYPSARASYADMQLLTHIDNDCGLDERERQRLGRHRNKVLRRLDGIKLNLQRYRRWSAYRLLCSLQLPDERAGAASADQVSPDATLSSQMLADLNLLCFEQENVYQSLLTHDMLARLETLAPHYPCFNVAYQRKVLCRDLNKRCRQLGNTLKKLHCLKAHESQQQHDHTQQQAIAKIASVVSRLDTLPLGRVPAEDPALLPRSQLGIECFKQINSTLCESLATSINTIAHEHDARLSLDIAPDRPGEPDNQQKAA